MLIATLLAAASSAQAGDFLNPSFEDDTGWPVGHFGDCPTKVPANPPFGVIGWDYDSPNAGYGGHVVNGGAAGPTPFGNQFIWLDGGTKSNCPGHPGHAFIQQTVPDFIVGQDYRLTFSIASEDAVNGAVSRIALTLTGAEPSAPVFFLAGGGDQWDTWVDKAIRFTATSTTVTFRFEHVDPLPLRQYNGVGLDNVAVAPCDSGSIRDIDGTVNIYESTFAAPTQLTWNAWDPVLLTRLSGQLDATNNDFVGAADEYYDVFYSDANGSPNPAGSYLTIECRFDHQAPSGGGLNIAGVSLNVGSYTEWASRVVGAVYLGDNFVPNSANNAVGANLTNDTTMGNTFGTSARLRLTLAFSSKSGCGPRVPSSSPLLLALLGLGLGLFGWWRVTAGARTA